MECSDFRKVMDYRAFMDEIGDIAMWRLYLRKKLFEQRRGRSDLTRKSCIQGFDLHEGIFSRKYLPPNRGQGLLFAGPNCFVLARDEHIPFPPDRVTCYWLAVTTYGKELVDAWIDSLPFRSVPGKPWKDSNGAEVLARIPDKYRVDSRWDEWYNSVYKSVDIEG